MARQLAGLIVLCALAPAASLAQTQKPAAAPASASPFRPLDLPTPTQYRTASGRPGRGYWQQRVDYRIAATLDTAKREVRGRERIRYTNNSPDVLPYVWMFLEQNICAPTSISKQLDQPPLAFLGSTFDFSCKGFDGGVKLERVSAGGRTVRPTVHGTTMRIDLPRPLAPGAALDFEVAWRFRVPPYGAGRMGRDGSLYEIAQWYPRLAVYDDVRGWNHDPFIGAGEFYLEYGSFDVSLTVPANYIVAATGTLRNPEHVLTSGQRSRLAIARRSVVPVAVITASEAGQPDGTRPSSRRGQLTWRFTADSVRDFAFAAAPDFRWDASAYRGILVHTLYRPSAPEWEEANRMVREALRYFNEQWYDYPYPHITSVEGPVEGMEYPMLTFNPRAPSREERHWVLAHELGHQWLPMMVGSNERLYPWMDEGFNTFIDLAAAAGYFAGTRYGDSIETNPLRLYQDHAVSEEQPLITRPVEVKDLFWTGYQKPALMLQVLRYEVMGKERFDHAFREYLRAWAFKHPTPADFFRIMRDASGMDLDWFWRDWVYTTVRLGQAVDSVGVSDGAEKIFLANRGTMTLPLEMDVTYSDGSTERIRLPVEMWNLGPRFAHRVPEGKSVRRVLVDPRRALPDVDRANNERSR